MRVNPVPAATADSLIFFVSESFLFPPILLIIADIINEEKRD
jgi:hypothetical protein